MADRYFHPISGSLDLGICLVQASIDIGATGAPTLDSSGGNGIASIARTGAGQYTLTLDDQYVGLYAANISIFDAASGDHSAIFTEDNTSSAAKTLKFETKTAGVTADLPNPSKVYIGLTLKNTSVV